MENSEKNPNVQIPNPNQIRMTKFQTRSNTFQFTKTKFQTRFIMINDPYGTS